MKQRTIAQLLAAVGGLSEPSKMPCYGWSIPAARCKVGSLLRQKQGTVCSKCYAMKGRYVMPIIEQALKRRYQILMADMETWAHNMAELIQRKRLPYFRWHDSGDLQSKKHLNWIMWIAEQCPDTKFWLPTREYGILKQVHGKIPKNLCIRVAAPMVGGTPATKGFPTCTVGAGEGFACPARKQGNQCKKCRACWNAAVENVNYELH